MGAPDRRRASAARTSAPGRLQKLLAGRDGGERAAARVEIYLEHYRGSFGDRWMWTPICSAAADGGRASPASSPSGGADVAARRVGAVRASTASSASSRTSAASRKRPGGFREPTYNLVMGPPLLAPGSLGLVGALGLLAAVVKRER